MILDNKKNAFGRHQTFGLRYSWLTKGFALSAEDFNSEDASVKLGVGKNMVKSIEYWIKACQLVDRELNPTVIGKIIFSENGYDPFMEDEATIWLIHWLLATNLELATAWYWFFNFFQKPEFSSQEVQTALNDFVRDKLKTTVSLNTIKGDASLILRMYSQNQINTRMPLEESLDSPLSLLRLVSHSSDGRQFYSKLESRNQLPIGILGYAVTDLFNALGTTSLPIEELMYSQRGVCAPGVIFRLTENELIAKLELLVKYLSGVYEIRESAGIHQLYKLKEVSPIDFLDRHYQTLGQAA